MVIRFGSFDTEQFRHNRNYLVCTKYHPIYLAILHILGANPDGVRMSELFRQFQQYCDKHRIKHYFHNQTSLQSALPRLKDTDCFYSVRVLSSDPQNKGRFYYLVYHPTDSLIERINQGTISDYLWKFQKQKYKIQDKPIYADKN